MKLLVCIKQVPDLESRFKPNAEASGTTKPTWPGE